MATSANLPYKKIPVRWTGILFAVAGLVTERFAGGRTSRPGGFTPPEQMKSSGPCGTCPIGIARHGKAFEGLLKRYFG